MRVWPWERQVDRGDWLFSKSAIRPCEVHARIPETRTAKPQSVPPLCVLTVQGDATSPWSLPLARAEG